MANPPPPSPFSGQKSSLEAEPTRVTYDEHAFPDSSAILGEKDAAARMEVKGKSARDRASVSLESLKERTKTRSYDKETPELINRVTLFESHEQQQDRLDALKDVSVVMLATLLYHHPDLEKKFDLSDFANIPLLGEVVAQSDPRPAENAAFHKLRELRDNPESEVSKYLSGEWGQMVATAREVSKNITIAASTHLGETLGESDRWTVKGFIHQYPKWSAAIAIGGAVAGFFMIRGIYRALTKSGEESEKAGEKTGEKPKGSWGWVKWALGGVLALFGLGAILKWDKTLDWIKGMGEKASDAWDSFFGDKDFAKNKEMYVRMAGRIGSEISGAEAKVTIDPKFLGGLHDKKLEDIIDDDSWMNKYLIDPVLDTDTMDSVAKHLPGNFVYTKAQRNQYRAIRAYLKGSERQALIAEMGIADDAPLGEVLAKLDQRLNQGTGAPGTKPGEKTPEWTPANLEAHILPYLKENYGTEIAAEDFRKIAKASYRDLMAWKGARSYLESLRSKAREAGAQAGISTATTPAEQRLIDGENTMRRFFIDNETLLTDLHLPESLPAGATVGDVLMALAKGGKFDAFTKKEVVGGAFGGVALGNGDVEATHERDEAAKKLPEETWNVYTAQRKMLRQMCNSGEYVKVDDTNKLVAAAKDLIGKINTQALNEPDKAKREKIRTMGRDLQTKIAGLERAMHERSQQLGEYASVINGAGSAEDLHTAFVHVIDKNGNVTNAYATLEQDLTNERQWRSVGLVAALQGIRIGYIHFRTPDIYKAWLEHSYGRLGVPTQLAKRISERLRRPSGGIELLERQITEGEARLTGTLGDDLKGRAKITDETAPLPSEDSISKITDEKHRSALRRYKAEKELLEHDRQLLDLEKEVAGLKTVPPEKMLKLKEMRLERTKLSKNALGQASEDLYKNLSPREGPLKPSEFEQLDDLARRTSEHNRDLMHAGDGIIEDIRHAAAKGDAAEVARLQKIFNETIAEIPKTQKGAIRRFFDFVGTFLREKKNISRGAIRETLDKGDQKKFRQIFAHVLHWQREGAKPVGKEGTSMLRIVGKKLRFFQLALGGTVAAGVALATKDKQTGVLPAIGHAAFDVAPGTGEYSDFYTLATGREIFTGRKVSKFERFVVRPTFGAVGLASDILLVLSLGTSFGISAGVSSLKGAYGAAKLARLGGKALAEGALKKAGKEAAEKVGVRAAEEAVERTVAREGAEAAAETAAKTGVRAGAQSAVKAGTEAAPGEAGKLAAVLKRIEKTGVAATVALGIGGLTMSLIQSDEMETTPEMDAVAGGTDGKIDELDLEQLPEDTPQPH